MGISRADEIEEARLHSPWMQMFGKTFRENLSTPENANNPYSPLSSIALLLMVGLLIGLG
jgi:hypothetical protein